ERQALDRAEKERCRRGNVGCGREIRRSNRVFEKRRHLAFVPSVQSVKLLVQSGVLVANVVGKYDLGQTWIFYDQFDVTEKHPSQRPYEWRIPLTATGFRPGICKPVLANDEAARVHHAAWRRGSRVAARGARAAGRDVDNWLSQRRVVLGICAPSGGLSPGSDRDWLCRRPQCVYRISLGGRSLRSIAEPGGRSSAQTSGRDFCEWPCGSRRQGGDHDNSNRLRDGTRPGRVWACRQLEPTGRQSHRR